jgi:hypothetical protein
MYDQFNINIDKCRTLPSLCFKVYTTKFLKNKKIPIIIGEIYDHINQSYKGGLVDIYRPIIIPGKVVNAYDINSLYPTAMRNMPMPVGSPIYFESPGNPDEYKNKFGFFFVTIIAPNLYAPILQTRTLNKKGVPIGSSICPTGT